MGESTKAVCILLACAGGVVGLFSWFMPRPNEIIWGIRIVAPATAILALTLFLKLRSRTDLAHDYLRDRVGTYFHRDGLGFMFAVTAVDGIAYMDVHFQNQRDKRCAARIALWPASLFFRENAVETVAFEIDCAPAAFGFARLAIPIPTELQGTRQSFQVGASIRYPDGKGKRLRFHDGMFVRANADFGNPFLTTLTIVGVFVGMFIFSKPAAITFDLPVGVAKQIPDYSAPEIRTLWRSGDAPLKKG